MATEAKKTFKAFTVKQENEMLSLLSKTQTELNGIIQNLAINAIAYSIQHGDTRPANRLIARFEGGLRKQTLVHYLEAHGNIKWETEDVSEPQFIFRKKEDREFDYEKLSELLWYKAKNEEVVSSIPDVEDDVRRLLKKVQSRINKGKALKNASLAAYLDDAIKQWTADNLNNAVLVEDTAMDTDDDAQSPADLANAAQTNASDVAKAA